MNTLAFTRRLVFVLALLLTGATTIACIQAIYQQRPVLLPLANVLWGFDSLELVLAIWIAGRRRAWRSWSSWIRLTTYLLAFAYGRMLFDATQDWWTGTASTFQLPGLTYNAYGRPLITILPVMLCVLLLQPLFRALGVSLDELDRPPSYVPISVLDLLCWTILAAIICVGIRFLNANSAPVTGYSHSTLAENFKVQVIYLVVSLIPATVLLTQLFAWRRHWLLAVAVLCAGWVADSLVTGFATHLLQTTTGISLGVLSGGALERWCYIAGRSLLGFTFGGLALLFGVAIRRCQLQATEPDRAGEALDDPS